MTCSWGKIELTSARLAGYAAAQDPPEEERARVHVLLTPGGGGPRGP